ncbi:MAG: L-rhamnose mutarotase [Verrucomicrobia bacterium]|nr:L-rhamnose mutarotase [Verrucomicrobiota bacterium]
MPESRSSPCRRFCQTIGLKREQREYYLDLHRNIWPEIRGQI